jgi:hypothetical protein
VQKFKPKNFKQFCSTLNCHSSSMEIYDMARRYCGVQRSGFPRSLRRWCHLLSLSNFHFWVVERLNLIGLSSGSRLRIEELKSALELCKNSSRAWITLDLHKLGDGPSLGWSFGCGYITTVQTQLRIRYANCYDAENGQGPSFKRIPTDR